MHPENYTGERNANEVARRRKLCVHFTGILGFKKIRQRGSRKADLETDGFRRRKLKSGKERHTADA